MSSLSLFLSLVRTLKVETETSTSCFFFFHISCGFWGLARGLVSLLLVLFDSVLGTVTAKAGIISLLENCHNSDYFPEKYEGTLNIAHLTYDMADLRKRCPYILNL